MGPTLWWVGGAWSPRSSKEQLGFIQLMGAILVSQSAIFPPLFFNEEIF